MIQQAYAATTETARTTHLSRLRIWKRDPWGYLWRAKKDNAKKAGALFTITAEWTREAGEQGCRYLCLPFVMLPPQPPGSPRGARLVTPMTPTFDQLVPGAGYTPANTRIISWWANRAKGEQTEEEFIEFCSMVWESNNDA